MGLNQGFGVEPVYQGLGRVTGVETDLLGLPVGLRVKARQVRLHVGLLEQSKQAVVLAQTLMAVNGPVCDWPFWRGLGRRSLGSVLFSDPSVERGPLYFAKLPKHTAWVRRLLEDSVACQADGNEPIGGNKPIGGCKSNCSIERQQDLPEFYARCAQYKRGQGTTPLWVFEVFLPALQEFKSGTLE